MLRGLDPAQSDRNLRAMLDILKARNLPVLLTGMLAAPNMGPEYAGRFNAIYPALAKDYGIPLYPFFLEGVIGNAHYMQTDSIHPNPVRSEEHTSELQSLMRISYAVFCLKKKIHNKITNYKSAKPITLTHT